MKKIIFVVIIAVLSFVTPASAAVYIDQQNTGVNTVIVNGQAYVDQNQINKLFPGSKITKTAKLIPIRAIAESQGYYVQWNSQKQSIVLSKTHPAITWKVEGYSASGRGIQGAYLIPPNPKQKILCTFTMHGFEDQYDHDGQLLMDAGNAVIDYFSAHLSELNNTEIIIIPCVNPDGLLDGDTNNGIGRCDSLGIDINRDFDYNWAPINNSRNQTGDKPFTSPEAQMLRDLVLSEKPDIVIDIHGWYNCFYGNSELETAFSQVFDFDEAPPAPSNLNPGQGEYFKWASQYCNKTALLECPFDQTRGNAQKIITGLKTLISNPAYNGSYTI